MTCELCNSESEVHHIYSRGRWGLSAEVTANKINLCRKHHSQVHTIGVQTFAKKYGLEKRFSDAKWAVIQESVRETLERVNSNR